MKPEELVFQRVLHCFEIQGTYSCSYVIPMKERVTSNLSCCCGICGTKDSDLYQVGLTSWAPGTSVDTTWLLCQDFDTCDYKAAVRGGLELHCIDCGVLFWGKSRAYRRCARCTVMDEYGR